MPAANPRRSKQRTAISRIARRGMDAIYGLAGSAADRFAQTAPPILARDEADLSIQRSALFLTHPSNPCNPRLAHSGKIIVCPGHPRI